MGQLIIPGNSDTPLEGQAVVLQQQLPRELYPLRTQTMEVDQFADPPLVADLLVLNRLEEEILLDQTLAKYGMDLSQNML